MKLFWLNWPWISPIPWRNYWCYPNIGTLLIGNIHGSWLTDFQHFGTPTTEEKRAFTRVLQGHIAIDTAIFPNGTSGLLLVSTFYYFPWMLVPGFILWAHFSYTHRLKELTGHTVMRLLGRLSGRMDSVWLSPCFFRNAEYPHMSRLSVNISQGKYANATLTRFWSHGTGHGVGHYLNVHEGTIVL